MKAISIRLVMLNILFSQKDNVGVFKGTLSPQPPCHRGSCMSDDIDLKHFPQSVSKTSVVQMKTVLECQCQSLPCFSLNAFSRCEYIIFSLTLSHSHSLSLSLSGCITLAHSRSNTFSLSQSHTHSFLHTYTRYDTHTLFHG